MTHVVDTTELLQRQPAELALWAAQTAEHLADGTVHDIIAASEQSAGLVTLERVSIQGQPGEQHAVWEYEWYEGALTLYEIMQNLPREAGELPFPPQHLISLPGQLAAGVIALHRRQLVHRDIRPSNILALVGAGTTVVDPKLGDLENCHRAGAPQDIVLVSHAWAAPEQFNPGEIVRPAMDVYSLGLVYIYVLSGGYINPEITFESDQAFAHLEDKYRRGEKLSSDEMRDFRYTLRHQARTLLRDMYGEDVVEVLLRAIDRNPDVRYQTVAEMSTALTVALHERFRVPAEA